MDACRFVDDQGPELLELVEYEDEVDPLIHRQRAADGTMEPAVVGGELLDQAGRRVRRDAEQGSLVLLEGVRTRSQGDARPVRRAGEAAGPERGDQAGLDRR